MKAFHFLKADMRSDCGDEPPWQIGEERIWRGSVELCVTGYHSSPTLWEALGHARGPIACLVEVSEPLASYKTIQVSRSRKLLKALNIERELRLYAADCAERVLPIFERRHSLDARPRQAIEAARAFARGEISTAELSIAAMGAQEASEACNKWTVPWTARDAAATPDEPWWAAWAAQISAFIAVGAGAREVERTWQRERFSTIEVMVAQSEGNS